MSAFLKTFTNRRTQYALKNTLPEGVTIAQVQEIVQQFVKNTPTSFNSQTIRAVVLTGALHQKVWDAVTGAIEGESGKKRPTSAKEEAFGTIVFFDDKDAISTMQDKFPAFADYFPVFASTSNGAAQIGTWAAIGELGLGGHLQHYNGYVEAALKGKVPESWAVQAQLVFGTPTGAPFEKTFIENEVKVLDN
jgi:predicted oxidoreductase (fatty acid repression mutant protein)